ncbi:MAG TPA: Hpt domain-containing protein, partial [Phycisphaerae bacterium]|nr:Hpt domain-containing protein [Phycisphaerae bacterium]
MVATLRKWFPRNGNDAGAKEPAPAKSAPQTKDEARSLDGIQVEDALARLGISFTSLRKMLIRFADGQGRTLDDLRKSVADGDAAAAAKHAHAIAGAAGNLGADALRAAAKALEHAGREGRTDLNELLRAIDEHSATVLRSIDTLRDEPAAAAPIATQPFDAKKARAALGRLATALESFDVSASGEAIADLSSCGATVDMAAKLARVRDLVDGYEFEEAAGIAAALLKELEAGA